MKKNLKGWGKCFSVPCVTRFQQLLGRRAIAARLSRTRGSSYDFLRHIQQEQWIFPLENRPVARRAHARTFSSPPSWRRSFVCRWIARLALLTIVTAVSVQLRSLLDCSGHLQESSRKHVLLQATYLPRRKNTIAHSFGPFSFILAIVSLAEAEKQVFSLRLAHQSFPCRFKE